ncbi:membrane protein insertion efficiency factor YidD [Mycobacterium sp. WMMD1722]|uniref:membrane protein insertion efficiency factor YidD n=1 Tax=Mycobacterium sp. WMMD1722 TaxID=3404117 RepID=UPI003BF60FD4
MTRRWGRHTPARAVIFAIDLYRNMVSPLRLPSCRFTPTCSQYAVDALTEYGLIRGSWLALVRLAKCGPWHPGGWDPIPDRHGGAEESSSDRSGAASSAADLVRSTTSV